MEYKIELYEQMEQPALSVRTRTSVDKLPAVLGKSYAEIMEYLDRLGEMAADAPFVAYYNSDMQDLDVEVGFPVSRPLPAEGNIQSSMIPAGMYAITMHKGPYRAVEAAYNALMVWIVTNGHEAAGIAYEFYLNDPSNTDEADILTRIAMSLKG